jgi:hypothetical protein
MRLYKRWLVYGIDDLMDFPTYQLIMRRRSLFWRTAWRVSKLFNRVYMFIVHAKPFGRFITFCKLKIKAR